MSFVADMTESMQGLKQSSKWLYVGIIIE